MNIKQIVLILVIVGALAGAGVFAYLTFTGDSASSVVIETTPTNPILPHGATLNFKKVNDFNKSGQIFQYPAVTPFDIGLPLNEIIQKQ